MKRTLAQALLCLAAMAANATAPQVKNLWPEGQMPFDNKETVPEHWNEYGTVSHVSTPTLTIYAPDNLGKRPEANARVAVMLCPGGGYSNEAPNAAQDIVDWFTQQGITVGLLKYRLPNGGHWQATMADAEQGMRLLRQFAGQNDICKVGILGSSAGGHLASSQATHWTDSVTRPDFQILFYPVITLDPAYTHMGTRNLFLGPDPEEGLQEAWSNHLRVTPQTPPAIILASADDKIVPIQNSLDYFAALRANGVPAAMFIWPTGNHGWGHIHPLPFRRQWHDELQSWLEQNVIP